MNLENATQIILEGQRIIGLKTQDVEKLSISQAATSSFSVGNINPQDEVNGGVALEDHTINTAVIDNGVLPQSQVQTEIPSTETVNTVNSAEESVPFTEVQSNIFDVPQSDVVNSGVLQPEIVPDVSQTMPAYVPQKSTVPQVEAIPNDSVNMFDTNNLFEQQAPMVETVQEQIPEYSYYQEQPAQMAQQSEFVEPLQTSNIPLDTPQTFYEKQSDQEAQGGFTTVPMAGEIQDKPNFNTDPVVIMLDEVIRTVGERSKVTSAIDNENQILRAQNAELRSENEVLKQQIIELNNKVLIAEAQRQAAEQTLAGARMAETGMINNNPQVRTYQPMPQQPQTAYYQQAA